MSTEYLIHEDAKWDLTVYEHSALLDLVLIDAKEEHDIFKDLSPMQMCEIGIKIIQAAAYQDSDLFIYARNKI